MDESEDVLIGKTTATRVEVWLDNREVVEIHTGLKDAQGRFQTIEVTVVDGKVDIAAAYVNDEPDDDGVSGESFTVAVIDGNGRSVVGS